MYDRLQFLRGLGNLLGDFMTEPLELYELIDIDEQMLPYGPPEEIEDQVHEVFSSVVTPEGVLMIYAIPALLFGSTTSMSEPTLVHPCTSVRLHTLFVGLAPSSAMMPCLMSGELGD